MKESLNKLINYYQTLAILDNLVSIEARNKHNEEELKQTRFANAYSKYTANYEELMQDENIATLENLKNSLAELLPNSQPLVHNQHYSILEYFIKPLLNGYPHIIKEGLDIDALNISLFKYQNLYFKYEQLKQQKLIKLEEDNTDGYYQSLNELEKSLKQLISNHIFKTRDYLVKNHLMKNSKDKLYVTLEKAQKLLELIKISQNQKINKTTKDKETITKLINNMINSLNKSIDTVGDCKKLNDSLERYTRTYLINNLIKTLKIQIYKNQENKLPITTEEFSKIFNSIINIESLKNTLDLDYKIELLTYSTLMYTTLKYAQIKENIIPNSITISQNLINMINANKQKESSFKKSIKIDTY